jgi:organic hydroperoxide reductase OsmC/OhrA
MPHGIGAASADAGNSGGGGRTMSEHRAIIRWAHAGGDFLKGRYSREHTWTFDGGLTVPASPSPSVVPKPYSNAAHVDPEEAFVAAISSCHMLTFLYVAARAGFEVVSYQDDAVGTMTKNEHGVPWVSTVVLRPRITYAGGSGPDAADEDRLHHAAHEQCFIANSVKTTITVEKPQ